jgi:DNA-binding NarL/FixJ family response regulator
MQSEQIRVLIVDDHAGLRAGLRELLEMSQHFDVVGEAGDGETAVTSAASLSPDLIVMDISLPGIDGIEATRQILIAEPAMKVVMLTSHSDQERIIGALDAGAIGYVLKDMEPEQLLLRLRSAVGSGGVAP